MVSLSESMRRWLCLNKSLSRGLPWLPLPISMSHFFNHFISYCFSNKHCRNNFCFNFCSINCWWASCACNFSCNNCSYGVWRNESIKTMSGGNMLMLTALKLPFVKFWVWLAIFLVQRVAQNFSISFKIGWRISTKTTVSHCLCIWPIWCIVKCL